MAKNFKTMQDYNLLLLIIDSFEDLEMEVNGRIKKIAAHTQSNAKELLNYFQFNNLFSDKLVQVSPSVSGFILFQIEEIEIQVEKDFNLIEYDANDNVNFSKHEENLLKFCHFLKQRYK